MPARPLVEAVASDDFKGMLQGVRNHDDYTYAHSIRVATYLALFGFNLHLSKDEQVLLACGGLLHDVGKISIPLGVLNKPGRLNGQRAGDDAGAMSPPPSPIWSVARTCPRASLPSPRNTTRSWTVPAIRTASPGTELNRLARIASIVDVFTALTDRRAYKPPIEPEAALQIMVDEMASHLDIKLLSLFRQHAA